MENVLTRRGMLSDICTVGRKKGAPHLNMTSRQYNPMTRY